MQRLHVFVDEYGDAHLDVSKPGVSSTYIVAALCVRESALAGVRIRAEACRSKLFQSGEMKSSSIGSNDGRRIDVLNHLTGLDAFVIAFCAQKEKVQPESALQYKKTFIKFFAKTIYDRLFRYSKDIVVIADKHGSPEFQVELARYLESRFKTDLFQKASFDFEDSKENVLLQVADLFAGSLARVYDREKISDRKEDFRLVLDRRVSTTLWPSGVEDVFSPLLEHSDEEDERVRRFCVHQVQDYIGRHTGNDEDRDELARIAFLEILLAHHTLGGQDDFVTTTVLLREIRLRIGEPIERHRLRSAIVAKLRDADVVISSCSKGYKIPSCLSDVREFVMFANSQIPPMVARLARARKGVREATMGGSDILAGEDFAGLRTIVEAASS